MTCELGQQGVLTSTMIDDLTMTVQADKKDWDNHRCDKAGKGGYYNRNLRIPIALGQGCGTARRKFNEKTVPEAEAT